MLKAPSIPIDFDLTHSDKRNWPQSLVMQVATYPSPTPSRMMASRILCKAGLHGPTNKTTFGPGLITITMFTDLCCKFHGPLEKTLLCFPLAVCLEW